MLKKILSAVAALAVCVSALSGCAKNNENEIDNALGEYTEDIALLQDLNALPAGSFAIEPKRLSEEDVDELKTLFKEREKELEALDEEERTEVKERDWEQYTYLLAPSRLGIAEATLYETLSEFCVAFLNDPSHVALWKNTGYITSGSVNYAELGLDYRQAADVFAWFKYNNPQFYFLDSFAFDDTKMYLSVYGFAAKLGDPAKTTNELFDKLDKWIAECNKERTTLDKISAANRLICENTKGSLSVAADGKNLSVYSVLIGGEAVCSGYAMTFTAMANAMSIETYTVTGSSYTWNAAKFENGKYYYVDVCRNDTEEGYGDIFIGVGTDYAAYYDNGGSTYTAESYAVDLIPSVSSANYEGSDNIGSLGVPVLRIDGSGNRVVKLGWDKVEGAEKYECTVASGGTIYSSSSHTDNFMYVSFPKGISSVTIKIRAVGSEEEKRVCSAYTESLLTLTHNGEPPQMPANVTAENNGGVVISWNKNKSVDGWLVIAYGEDSTFTRAWMVYELEKGQQRLGWVDTWQPENDTYFSVMSVKKYENTEIYSDPVQLKFNINDGAEILSGDNSGGSGENSNGNYVTVEFSNGIYVGEMENGKMNGHGKLSTTNGDIYEGEWKDDVLIKGSITNYLSNGVYIFESDNFINDKTNGQSTHTVRFNSGEVSILKGNAKDGVISGNGTLEYSYSSSEGYVYEGELTDGVPNGQGVKTSTHSDGTTTVEDGVFKNGEIVKGEITDTFSNGTYIYECDDFVNGHMNGESKRTIKFNSGDVSIISGVATDGEICGEGTLDYTYASGSRFRYEGELYNNEMYGEGVKKTYYADGSYLIESGTFNIGLYNGTYVHYNKDDSIRVSRKYVNGKAT